MEEQKSPSVLAVTDPAAAATLTDPHALKHLEPFLGRECTVGQAAKETGEKPNTMLKRVRRFVALGLVEIAREEPRKGRALKVYRSRAEVFFVPFEASSAESLEQQLAERDAYYERLLRRQVVRARMEAFPTWGTRIYRDARGRLQVQTAINPFENVTTLEGGAPAVLSAWRDGLMLDYADAKALQRELFELLLRYQRKGGSQRYLLRLGLAPIWQSD
jgi:hypothetical protein